MSEYAVVRLKEIEEREETHIKNITKRHIGPTEKAEIWQQTSDGVVSVSSNDRGVSICAVFSVSGTQQNGEEMKRLHFGLMPFKWQGDQTFLEMTEVVMAIWEKN